MMIAFGDRFAGISASVAVMAAVLMLSPGCGGSNSAQVWPEYGAESSTTYEIRTHVQTNQAVVITGEQGAADTLAIRFTIRVLETHDDGSAEIELSIDRLMNRTYGTAEVHVEFDSARADEENKPESLLGVYRAAKGTRALMSIDERGRVTSVTGLAGVESAFAEAEAGALLGGVFSEGWWSDLAEGVFRLGSDRPRVGVGVVWTNSRTETQEYYLTLSELVDYRVVSVTADRVEIEGEGTFTVDMAKDAFASVEGGAIDEQAITTRIVWDRERGRLLESHEERLLQLSQTWQGMAIAKRYVLTRSVKRVVGGDEGLD